MGRQYVPSPAALALVSKTVPAVLCCKKWGTFEQETMFCAGNLLEHTSLCSPWCRPCRHLHAYSLRMTSFLQLILQARHGMGAAQSRHRHTKCTRAVCMCRHSHAHRLAFVQTFNPCSHAKVCVLTMWFRSVHHATHLSGQVILSSLFMVLSKHKAAVLFAHCQPP